MRAEVPLLGGTAIAILVKRKAGEYVLPAMATIINFQGLVMALVLYCLPEPVPEPPPVDVEAAAAWVTVKLDVDRLPESVTAEVVSSVLPERVAMLICSTVVPVQVELSMGPVFPPIVACAAEKVSVPKLSSGRMRDDDGASVIHSAEERW